MSATLLLELTTFLSFVFFVVSFNSVSARHSGKLCDIQKEDCNEICGRRGFSKILQVKRVRCPKEIRSTKFVCKPKKYISGLSKLEIEPVGKDGAIISWRPKVEQKDAATFYEYVCASDDLIVLKKLGKKGRAAKYLESGTTEDDQVKLEGLLRGQTYTCQVRLIRGNRRSRLVKASFKTPEDAPSTPPWNIRFHYENKDIFSIQWEAPKLSNGKIMNYEIVMTDDGENRTLFRDRIAAGTGRKLFYLITSNLTSRFPGKLVNFLIAAETSAGLGPYGTATILLPPYDGYDLEDSCEEESCGGNCERRSPAAAYFRLMATYIAACKTEVEVGQCN